MIDFYAPILYVIPIVGILLGSYVRIKFNRFIAVYIFLSVIASFIQWLNNGLLELFISLGIAAVGGIIGVSLLGIFGDKYRISSYMILISSVGLFPWFLSPVSSYVYLGFLVSSFVFTFLLDKFRKRNFRSKKETKPRLLIAIPPVFGALLSLLLFF